MSISRLRYTEKILTEKGKPGQTFKGLINGFIWFIYKKNTVMVHILYLIKNMLYVLFNVTVYLHGALHVIYIRVVESMNMKNEGEKAFLKTNWWKKYWKRFVWRRFQRITWWVVDFRSPLGCSSGCIIGRYQVPEGVNWWDSANGEICMNGRRESDSCTARFLHRCEGLSGSMTGVKLFSSPRFTLWCRMMTTLNCNKIGSSKKKKWMWI